MLQSLLVLQLGYKLFDPLQSDTNTLPSFYQINPSYDVQSKGLVELLLYFKWNWIGIITLNNDNGENFIRTLTAVLAKNNICVASAVKTLPEFSIFNVLSSRQIDLLWNIQRDDVHVEIIAGGFHVVQNILISLSLYEQQTNISCGKVWILTTEWEFAAVGMHYEWWNLKSLHGALSFRVHASNVPGFHHFLSDLDPYHPQGDIFLRDWWEVAFVCEFLKSGQFSEDGIRNCTGEEKVEDLPTSVFDVSMTGDSYNVYNAVYSVAHALHAVYLSGSKHGAMWKSKTSFLRNMKPWQVIPPSP